MYNINILSKCDDEKIRVAIITAVSEFMMGSDNLIVTRMQHGKIDAPVWNAISRRENLSNNF